MTETKATRSPSTETKRRPGQATDRDHWAGLVADYFHMDEGENPWEWMETNIELGPETPYPGPYSTDFTPFVRPVIRDVMDDANSQVTILCSAQSAKTQTLIALVLYIVANDPGSMFWVTAAADEAKEFSKTRLKPALEACPGTRDLMPTVANKQGTVLLQLLTMTILLRGSNSKSKLQSTPVRWLVLDEVRNYALGALDLVLKRVRSYWNSRIVRISTADQVNDAMHQAYLEGSQTNFHFTCPHCKHSQPFRFSRKTSVLYPEERQRGGLIWETNEDTKPGGVWSWKKVVKTVRFECEECAGEIWEKDRDDLADTIHPVDYNQDPEPGHRSYHWNALIVPWIPWADIVVEFLKAIDAMKRGSIEQLKAFITESLGEPFELTGERPIESEIYARHRGRTYGEPYVRGEYWNETKEQIVRVLTADVQGSKGGHIKWAIRQWCQTYDSRLVNYGIALDFDELREIQKDTESLVCIDSAFRTSEVYQACLRFNWIPLRGSDQEVFFHRNKKGEVFRRPWKIGKIDPMMGKEGAGGYSLPLLTWSNPAYKDRLGLVIMPGAGPTWQIPEDTGPDYLDELTNNERRQKRTSANATKYYWHKIGIDDWHDCELMQIAVMDSSGIVFSVDKPGDARKA